MSFVTRELSFKIQLGTGSFGEGGFDTVDIPAGLWATAVVNKLGSPTFNSADITINGLPLDLMNRLTRIGLQPATTRNNIITIMASDTGGKIPPSTVFCGVIQEAWTDFRQPEAPFRITANTGQLADMKPVEPKSYTGSTDVATIMKTLATQMGYTLEDNGVKVQLSNPYLPGSARQQALAVAEAAEIYVYFEDDNGIMAIMPKNGTGRKTPIPVISPTTGMEGYPSFVGPGMIDVTTLYNPLLRFMGNFRIMGSQVDNANALWQAFSLVHDLSTAPDGPWFSRVRALIQNEGSIFIRSIGEGANRRVVQL
jgi:hypothetical protein